MFVVPSPSPSRAATSQEETEGTNTRLFGVPVGRLASDDITGLISNQVGESRTREFKLALPGDNAEAKKEFLADVSAFANSTGGVILFGIQTQRDANGDTGIAAQIVGCVGVNVDREKLRLSAMLHDGIAPSLASHVVLQDVNIAGADGPVIALGVSQSLARPHMISYQRSGKFWRRSDSGKYQPDIAELRSMFLENEAWLGDIDKFRQDRIDAVRNKAVVPSLNLDASLFAHVLPLGRLRTHLDLAPHSKELGGLVPPMESHGFNTRFNAEGFLVFHAGAKNLIQSYTQWFRSGGIEGYDAHIIAHQDYGGSEKVKELFAEGLGRDLTVFVQQAVEAMNTKLQVDPPYAICVSLVGVAGSRILRDRLRYVGERIVPDDLLLAPVVIDDPSIDIAAVLRPILDVMWQSAGYAGAPATT